MKAAACLVLPIILFLLSGCGAHSGYNKPPEEEANAILDRADSLFHAMKKREYGTIWAYLSKKSKNDIIHDTYKAIRAHNASIGTGVEYSRTSIEKDFQSSGVIARSYWDGYLSNFNPDMALEQSRWEMGPVNVPEAEILLWHRKSEFPARIRMFKEEGSWKVGLVETFKYSKR